MGGKFMERSEALSLLKQVSVVCKDLDGSSVSLVNPEVQAGASTGYMIHITNPIDAHELECLKAILEKNHLAMKSEVKHHINL
jgi:predicted secreted protein